MYHYSPLMGLPHLTIWNWLAQRSMEPALQWASLPREPKKVGNLKSSLCELTRSPASMLPNYLGSQTGSCAWMPPPQPAPKMCRTRQQGAIQGVILSKNFWIPPYWTMASMRTLGCLLCAQLYLPSGTWSSAWQRGAARYALTEGPKSFSSLSHCLALCQEPDIIHLSGASPPVRGGSLGIWWCNSKAEEKLQVESPGLPGFPPLPEFSIYCTSL